MSFQTGLSGLNAASRNLDVIGHNIANANTVGMKSSRAEFADLVATSLGVGGGSDVGIGVSISTVSQQFSQGNINITGNDLDVAINGGGFFQLAKTDGTPAYTRDGQFKLDKEGMLVTNSGANLMGYPTDPLTGVPTSATLQALSLPTSAPIGAKATAVVAAEFNLDARAKVAAGNTTTTPIIPPTPRATYGTSLNVYDAQGFATPVNLYFEKQAAANTWNVYGGIDVPAVAGPPPVAAVTYPSLGTLVFDAAGKLSSVSPASTVVQSATNNVLSPAIDIPANTIDSDNPNLTGKLPQVLTLDLGGAVSQFGAAFGVADLRQDGYTTGELTSLNIGENGNITARYSNGQTQSAGQIALAEFRNVQGLTPAGGGTWMSTTESGQPVQGSPGTGKFGALRSGAVEESNVDLTAELVNMMTAQRAYQANAQTIKTQDQVMSTLVNLR